MKTRIIQTRFWEDDVVQSVSKDANHLWIFLLSNKDIGMTNYYKMPDTLICYYTKLSDKELQKAKLELESTKKVFFFENWVFIPNLERENSYKNSPKNLKPYESELSHVPEKVRSHFLRVQADSDSSIHTTIDGVSIPLNNHNTEIINNKLKKEGGVGEEKKIIIINYAEIAKQLKTTEEVVKDYEEKVLDYMASTGKTYKNIPATIRNWYRRDRDRKTLAPKTFQRIKVEEDLQYRAMQESFIESILAEDSQKNQKIL